MRLMCFPYAGASAMVYLRWRRKVPDWLEIRPVELPGRGERLLEALETDWDRLTDRLAVEIAGHTDEPYALFGHSMGALLAFEMAHKLDALGLPPARALVVSGAHAPSRRDNRRFAALESDEQLLAEMQRLNGTEAAVLASEELMALTLPVLRADFKLCGQYQRRARAPLNLPLHVLAGARDETTDETLSAWQTETVARFSLDRFDGDHFFIQSREADVLATLCRYLRSGAEAVPAMAY
jgi:surfactin synthase thioesterase subunit